MVDPTAPMFANAIFDVALGLLFLYTLLSLVTTSITEGCANLLSARSRALDSWLVNMLDDQAGGRSGREVVNEMLEHPLLRGLHPHTRRLGLRGFELHAPDYIPAATFTAVLLEVVGPTIDGNSEIRRRPRTFEELEAMLDRLPEDSPLRKLLLNLITTANGDLRQAEGVIEDWFEEAMDRLRNWYTRRSQLAAFSFAALLTWTLNADTLMVTDTLWHDAELRTVLAAHAERAVSGSEDGDGPSNADELASEIAELNAIAAFPLGWSTRAGNSRAVPETPTAWFMKLLGFALTILATTLGAPFWYRLLTRVINLRGNTRTRGSPGGPEPGGPTTSKSDAAPAGG